MADPTADLRQQLADHEADKDNRDTKCFNKMFQQNVSTVEDCRRKQGDGTVGTRAVVSWPYGSGLHARIEVSLPPDHEFKNRQNKKTPRY